jgi:hypothetical protein
MLIVVVASFTVATVPLIVVVAEADGIDIVEADGV